MKKIIFKCLQCGQCCRTLLKDVGGNLKGLGLILEETRLFPKELISPSMGIGYGIGNEPKIIFMYQLNVNECPHLSDNNLCKVHQERPSACRVFPLISLGPYGTSVASDCSFIEEYEHKYGSLNALLSPRVCRKIRNS